MAPRGALLVLLGLTPAASFALAPRAPIAAHAPQRALASVSRPLMVTSAFDDPTGIAQAFFFVTFVPQNFWLLIVFAPNWKFTRQVFEPLWPVCVVALAHLYIVQASAGCARAPTRRFLAPTRARARRLPPEAGTAPIELFNNLFNPVVVSERGIDVYQELSNFPNFAAEEWTHELTWDLFVGRWIWLEGRRRKIFTSHSVLLTNLIGPPGLLLHVLTVQVRPMRPAPRHELVYALESSGASRAPMRRCARTVCDRSTRSSAATTPKRDGRTPRCSVPRSKGRGRGSAWR